MAMKKFLKRRTKAEITAEEENKKLTYKIVKKKIIVDGKEVTVDVKVYDSLMQSSNSLKIQSMKPSLFG